MRENKRGGDARSLGKHSFVILRNLKPLQTLRHAISTCKEVQPSNVFSVKLRRDEVNCNRLGKTSTFTSTDLPYPLTKTCRQSSHAVAKKGTCSRRA